MFGYEHDDAIRSNNRRYRIVKVDDSGTQQRVDLSGLPKEKPEEVWRPMAHGFTSNPPKDSDGYMVGMGGRSDRMLYVDGGHKQYRPRNLPEGAVALYNHSGDIVRVFEQIFDVVHSKRINLKIGKGQDVSGKDGSKPPANDDEVNISVVLTGQSLVITYDDVSWTLVSGKGTFKGPKCVIDSEDIRLGGEDANTLIGLCGGGCATRVRAI